jgi:hypothetical protein
MLAVVLTGLMIAGVVDGGDDGAAAPAIVPSVDADDGEDDSNGNAENDGGTEDHDRGGDTDEDSADEDSADEDSADDDRADNDREAEPDATPRRRRPGKGGRGLPLPAVPALPQADDLAEGHGDWSPVLVDGSVGCALGGVVPALGATTGLGLFYGSMLGGTACGSIAGFVGGISGALVAIPSLLLLGPCAGGGAACGASVGAVLSDKDVWRAAQWSLPGVLAGTLGGSVAAAGLLVSSSTNPANEPWALPVGTTLVVVGTMLAVSGGPLAVAGATLTQADDPDEDPAPKKVLRDGGVEAHVTPRTPRDGDDAFAMNW